MFFLSKSHSCVGFDRVLLGRVPLNRDAGQGCFKVLFCCRLK